jgi:DNA-binding transcriptional MerR regulator
MAHLMPIGRFSRACRLSLKALRHYDELGLLRPALVDARSGYRYYSRAQARHAIAIGLLRSLGVPLPEIRALLAAETDDAIARLLAAERDRLEREVARGRDALRSIERIMREGDLLPYDVATRDERARLVLTMRGTTSVERHVEETTALVGELIGRLDALPCGWSGPVIGLFPGMGEADVIPVAVCGEIPRDPGPVEGAEVEELPGGLMAVTMHVGAFEEIGLAYHALFAGAQERGYEPAGPVREHYLSDPDVVPPEELATEVLLPLAPAR